MKRLVRFFSYFLLATTGAAFNINSALADDHEIEEVVVVGEIVGELGLWSRLMRRADWVYPYLKRQQRLKCWTALTMQARGYKRVTDAAEPSGVVSMSRQQLRRRFLCGVLLDPR